MTLFVCWVLFPLLLAAVSLGCGLAVARLARTRISAPLLVPLGFAACVVISSFASLTDATARLALPTVLAVAAVGLACSIPRTLPRLDAWAIAAAVATFAAFGAPVLLSGEATFAGYIKLDDTATFLALIDRALEHGRSLDGLAPSSYEATLAVNLPFYPLGSLLPLGFGARLVGQDPAWVFQPYLAFLAALLALVLYQLAGLVVSSRALRAVVATLGAQAALLYGYALWGGIKELAAAPLAALVAALAGALFQHRRGGFALVPLAVAAAALVGVLSVGAAAWLLPVAGVAVVTTLKRGDRRRPLVFAAFAAALVVPSLAVARLVLGAGVLGSIRDSEELGNLIAPLSALQAIGVWPSGDFRVRPEAMGVTYVLLALAVLAAAAGIAVAVTRRAWEIPLYAASTVGAAAAFGLFASPWVEAKAFAIASPTVVFAAGLGGAVLVSRGRRAEGVVALTLLAIGVLWSNALAFREVNLAPRAQLAELEQVGSRFAGHGPALMTEYQPYGVRHFLRDLDAEGASELRRRLIPLRDGSSLAKGRFADISAFRPEEVLVYRTLVLRRSPVVTRPLAAYRLVWQGRFYEVWQRSDGQVSGDAGPCHGRAATFPVPVDGRIAVSLPRGGRYELWIGGSFRGRLTTRVDGRRVGSDRHQLSQAGQFVPLGTVEVAAGAHTVELRQERGALQPGSGGAPWPIGPFALTPVERCGSGV